MVTSADVHVNADTSLEHLITKLSADVREMFTDLSSRIDRLESGLEQKISSKVAQLFDKRVIVELGRIKKDVSSQVESFKESMKAEIAADIADINDKVSELSLNTSTGYEDVSHNIVIRSLPESGNERIDSKVNSLFRDGLKINNISVASAERKKSQDDTHKPGLIIATLKSISDKKRIMSAKNKLKDHRQYSSVHINHDQSRSERIVADNFRTILSAIKQGDTNLSVRGFRVVRTDSSNRTPWNRRESSSNQPPRDDSRSSLEPLGPSHGVRSVNSRDARPRNSFGRSDRESYRGNSRYNRR